MALLVGELNALVSVDDRAVDPALRRAEQAMRSTGQQMGDDADRAGREVGERLGEGITRGADGRLGDARGRFLGAGRQAGDSFGEGLGDGAGAGADDAVEAAGSSLERLKTVALGAGVAAGAILMEGFGQALEQGQITGRLGAQLGTTGPEAQRYGHIAGAMYADAVTEDFQGAADAISVVMRAGIMPTGATDAQIQHLATQVSDLASAFELDLGQTANAVGQMIKNGLAKDGTEAVDVLTRGLQKMGPRADDIADTFNEYSTIFRNMGLDATTATGLLSQGMQAGARDTDVVADGLKEFLLTVQGGGKDVDSAFRQIGLSGSEMQKAFTQGGPKAAAALDVVFDRLRKIKDPAKRNALAVALFKTKSEDMQKALYALDPSKAVSSLGQVGGAADQMGDSLRNNAGVQLEQFKRRAMQSIVEVIGGKVVPTLSRMFNFVQQHQGVFKVAAAVVTAVLVPALILMGVTATVRSAQVALGWVRAGAASVRGAAVQVGSAARVVGAWLMMAARGTVAFLRIAASASLSAARTAVVWAASAARMTATWLVSIIRTAAVTAGQFVMMAARAIAWAATMAAQWLIAMGPIGWITIAVIGLVALVIANWDRIKAATLVAWDWVVGKLVWAKDALVSVFMNFTLPGLLIKHWSSIKSNAVSWWNGLVSWVKGVPRMLYNAFLNFTLIGLVIKHWSSIKTATVTRAMAMVAWVRGLPGRISGAMGPMGSLLVQKGRNVVQGLWNGISGMGGWLRGRIMGWARSVIPGPIAKALGIHSPSKVTATQGRWIARGLIDGLTGSSKQVKAASTKLADIVADSMRRGSRRSGALKRISADSKRLVKLANQRERVATRLKDAQKKLADLTSSRDKLAADVKKGVLDSANITTKGNDGWPVTATSILDGLKQDRLAAERFAKSLATLRKKGVRADLIAQIAQAGVEQGSSAAAALANANSGQIKQINKEQAALVAAAGRAGNSAGDAMYGAGIHAAQGLVKGLQSQQKAIESQMLRIAKGMSKAIRAALGIKSPSRVMALVGQYTAQGLIQGVEGQRSAVNRSMAALVETPAPGSWDMASASARVRVAEKVVIEFRSDQQGEAAYLMGKMRRGVQKTAGGDVQFAFSGKRSN
ncbi:phage tail tape measure protein [Streptomyces sp. NPDC058459]|uniref:phage tail tape measure protein n=1 Tax=Streptomyces sp. NPDC058459 TaxID=3346508 RepID=UPI0036606FB2